MSYISGGITQKNPGGNKTETSEFVMGSLGRSILAPDFSHSLNGTGYAEACAFLIDAERVGIIGGYGNPSGKLSSFSIYNIRTSLWTAEAGNFSNVNLLFFYLSLASH